MIKNDGNAMNTLKLIRFISLMVVMVGGIRSVDRFTKEQEARFSHSALDLGYYSWELVHTYRGDALKTLSRYDQKRVIKIGESVDLMIDKTVRMYNQGDHYESASLLAKELMELCMAVNVSYGTYRPMQSLTFQLEAIEKSVKGLRSLYAMIAPPVPLWHRVKSVFLYNKVSTELIPQFLKMTGASFLVWGTGWFLFDMVRLKFKQGKLFQWLNSVDVAQEGVTAQEQQSLKYQIAMLLGHHFHKAGILLSTGYLMRTLQWEGYQARLKEAEKKAESVEQQGTELMQKDIQYELEVSFETLKGLTQIKTNDLGLVVDYLQYPFKYHGIQKKGTFSVLLYGPPGTGKTLAARAIAKESGAPFVEINADDIFSDNAKDKIMYATDVAKKVAAMRSQKSAIIYIDELDCVSTNRDAYHEVAPDAERAKALANLLTLLDGVRAENPYLHIVVIMTTNHWRHLDPALMRPGRIDRKIGIGLPDPQTRYEYLKSLIVPALTEDQLRKLVVQTEGYTGAYLDNMVNGARLYAIYQARGVPSYEDYVAQIARISKEIDATAVMD